MAYIHDSNPEGTVLQQIKIQPASCLIKIGLPAPLFISCL